MQQKAGPFLKSVISARAFTRNGAYISNGRYHSYVFLGDAMTFLGDCFLPEGSWHVFLAFLVYQ